LTAGGIFAIVRHVELALSWSITMGTMIGEVLSSDVTARIIADHLYTPVFMDDKLYIPCGDVNMIAHLMIRLGVSAYIYNDVRIGAGARDYLSVTVPVLTTWKHMYAGKRGRKPNIALYVIDSNGFIQEVIRP
jgi:hypothetical protein